MWISAIYSLSCMREIAIVKTNLSQAHKIKKWWVWLKKL